MSHSIFRDEAITDAEPGSKPASKKVPSDDSCVVILPSEVLDVIFHAPTKSLILRPTPRLAAGSGWSTLSAGGPEATGTQCVIIRHCHDEPTNVPESVWMSGAVQVRTSQAEPRHLVTDSSSPCVRTSPTTANRRSSCPPPHVDLSAAAGRNRLPEMVRLRPPQHDARR